MEEVLNFKPSLTYINQCLEFLQPLLDRLSWCSEYEVDGHPTAECLEAGL